MGWLKRILSLTLMIVATFGRLYSQSNGLPIFKQITHPFMPSITSEYFYFSEDGLMWFSTAQGLTSFDGSEVIYHSSVKQSNSFGLSRISSIVEDKDHNFYMACGSGIHYYNRRTKIFSALNYEFKDKPGASNVNISNFYLDKTGVLYAGSISNGLFVYNTSTGKIDHFNIEPDHSDSWESRLLNSITCFAPHASDSNNLWIGTYNGIYLFDKIKKTFSQNFEVINPGHYAYKPSILTARYNIEKMDVADDSTIWFNCWTAGFGKYNTKTGKTKLFLNDARLKTPVRYIGYIISRFAKLSDGKYLLGIYDGKTAVFDTRTESAIYFNVTKHDFPEEATRFVTNDRQGNVWLLQRGFIYAAVPNQFRLQTVIVPNRTSADFQPPKIRGIYFDTASHLFYCAFLHSTGVHVYDTNFKEINIIPTEILNNYYTYNATIDYSIAKDGSGRFWTEGWENYVMDQGKNNFELISKVFASLKCLNTKDVFNDVKATRAGDILYRKDNGIIYHINHITLSVDSIIPPLTKAAGVEIKNPADWYDSNRDLFYVNLKQGMAQYSLGNKEIKIIAVSSLFGNMPPEQNVCVAALDEQGKIWFMIPKYGIRILDPETLQCIDSIRYGTNGLIEGGYTAMLGGNDHMMLFRSANGIVIYDYKRKFSFLFDHSNGLSTPENKSFLYSNGYLIIGQSSRFEYFKLSNLANYSAVITPHLNTIFADTTAVFKRSGLSDIQSVRLPYYQNSLSFSFSAPEFFFPERLEYAYQLTGVDEEWKYTNSANHKISYSNLKPGKYIFKLMSQINGGNWEMSPVEYTIVIVPAFWQTTLFKTLVVIVIAWLIYYLYRRRIIAYRKKEDQRIKHEKELLDLEAKALRAQMNPHFIFNSLNSIKSLINKNENDAAASYLTTFSKLIRTLFQNSDKREISLYEELETCKLYTQLEKMRFGNKVGFVFNIDESIDLKDFKVPALIMQPFIENSIWHGLIPKETGGHVFVTVNRNNGAIQCTIDDDGIGRKQSRQFKTQYDSTYQSKGIGLTQSRLELDKLLNEREDSIFIIDKEDESGKPLGTKVVIIFKENRN